MTTTSTTTTTTTAAATTTSQLYSPKYGRTDNSKTSKLNKS